MEARVGSTAGIVHSVQSPRLRLRWSKRWSPSQGLGWGGCSFWCPGATSSSACTTGTLAGLGVEVLGCQHGRGPVLVSWDGFCLARGPCTAGWPVDARLVSGAGGRRRLATVVDRRRRRRRWVGWVCYFTTTLPTMPM